MITSRRLWGPEYERFRLRLVQARRSANLTQHQVALLLGQTQSFVAKSETGERRVDIVELIHFARVYRQSLLYFVPE